jgi:hypothetical protein
MTLFQRVCYDDFRRIDVKKILFSIVLVIALNVVNAQENVNDYFPSNVGNTWYYGNNAGDLTDAIMVRNSSVDRNDGTRLYLFEHQMRGIGSTSYLYSIKNNRVVILVFKDGSGRYNEYQMPYPQALAPAGQQWSYNDRGDDLRLSTRSASCSFDGNTYDDCILVEERIVSGTTVLRAKKSYYARGIGLVYVTLQSAGEAESVFMKLLRYTTN